MVFAEFERTCIQERVRDSVESRTNMGLFPGGRIPIGFDVEEIELHGYKTKKYVPLEDEIEQLKFIYDLYSKGGISLGRVQKALIENGYDTIRDSAWTTAKIRDVLRNPIYSKGDLDLYDFFNSQGIRIVDEMAKFDGSRSVYY